MRLLAILFSVFYSGWCHIISQDVKEYIARGCYDDGTLEELEDAIGVAFQESGGSQLDFNFLIPEYPNSDLMAYPVAVVRTPEKLELLVKKCGAQLEWWMDLGQGQRIIQYPAMHQAIKSLNLEMFKKILELGGTMQPCRSHINLVYELCERIIRLEFPHLPRHPIELLECALQYRENSQLLDDTKNQSGLTCMGHVFRFAPEDARENKMRLLKIMLDAGASPFALQWEGTTPLEIIMTLSDTDLVLEALNMIFLMHPENNPFHPIVDQALFLVDDLVELGAVMTAARLKRRNAVIRSMLLPEIAEALHSNQLRDPLATLIAPYLLQLYLSGV